MGLQKIDALLLSDLNLVFGVFDVVLSFAYRSSIRLKLAVATRIVFQWMGMGLIVHSFVQGTATSDFATLYLIVAGAVFLITRRKLTILAEDLKHEKLSSPIWVLIVYVAAYLMPLASLVNLGALLALQPSKDWFKTAVWALQTTIKGVCVTILFLYSTYYRLYAEAWHCYKQETRISEYKYGYCPAYTHQGSYLDPANVICRPNGPVKSRPCYGDRTYENLPRNWLMPGRWPYAVLILIFHITLSQAVSGVSGVAALFKHKGA